MKFPLFFFLALCISKAAAFGLYGCYERLLYWQAYQMDSGFSKEKQKIAKSCVTDSDTAKAVGPVEKGRCNLRQFLYYIAEKDSEKAKIADRNKLRDADISSEKSLDEVAAKLYEAGVGETYHPGHIYEGLTQGSGVAPVVDHIAQFIWVKSTLPEDKGRPNQQLFDLAEQARSRAHYGRWATASRDIGTEIRKKYDHAVWEKQPKNAANGEVVKDAPLVEEGLVKERMAIPSGGVMGWKSCDLLAAKKSVNAEQTKSGKPRINLRGDFVDPWSGRESTHQLNLEALENAKAKTNCK